VVPEDIGAPGLDHVRVSDADRDRVLAELRNGYAEGRLTHDTFGYRVDEVLRARVSSELRRLVADLPKRRGLGAAIRVGWRHALARANRRLRAWPPVLTLPGGPQIRFTIGREVSCDMTLADLTVSRRHASLQRGADGWLLADLGSTNGTRLNGWRVNSPIPVQAGDLVSFGAVTFVLTERPGQTRAGT
jgi:Domain of unknown function (DUF1707)/FHA domain